MINLIRLGLWQLKEPLADGLIKLRLLFLKILTLLDPANIRLENVLKKSFLFVFRRHLEDVLIKTNIFALQVRLQKTCSRRLKDVLNQEYLPWLYVFETSSRRIQDIFKKTSRRPAKTCSRRLKDVLNQDQYIRFGYASSKRLQDVFKTSLRRLQDVLPRRVQDVLLKRFQAVFYTFSRRLQDDF